MKYQYGVLRLDESFAALEHNNKILGQNTLGIEVTIPEFALRCGLGNIDPQHGANPNPNSSAIHESLIFPLPLDGAHLVTVRPDKDSFGAMAVLTLRAECRQINFQFVEWIGLLDSFGFHNARSIRPDLASLFQSESDALQVVVSDEKRWQSMEEKIAIVGRIISGEVERGELLDIASLKNLPYIWYNVQKVGKIVTVTAPRGYSRARSWANKRFPVALIFDPEFSDGKGGFRERWSLVRQSGHFDRNGFEHAINEAEAKAQGFSIEELKTRGYAWGGTDCIVSSSQRKSSILGKEIIVNLVRQFAESDQVS